MFRLLFAVALVLFAADPASASSRTAPEPLQGNPWLVSHGRATLKSAPADSFRLYGGPGTLEGKFQDAIGLPDRQGWTSRDRTDVEVPWHVSTYNAETLNGNGPGNRAMWCGQDATQQPGWGSAPGYGNHYDAHLVWSSGPLSDPSLPQTVELEFWFHHDTEPWYDRFQVEAWIGSGWTNLVWLDGTDSILGVFSAPGVRYPDDVSPLPIEFLGNDYGGDGGDEILLRLRVTSDGAWSDEDGLWPTDGAVQVDDITVRYQDGATQETTFDDFEGAGPHNWVPRKGPYAGDFAQVFAQATDLDPCKDNPSPFWGFMDDGTGPFNPDYTGTGTGGATSPGSGWSYGIPGGFVVNYNGGVSLNQVGLSNEIVSPPIAWDLPGAADDDPDIAAAILRFDVWNHAPLNNGIFWQWFVRVSTDGASTWNDWESRNFVYYGGLTRWENREQDFTDLLEPAPTHVQVAFRVEDLAVVFAFVGQDATPAPWFDNVSVTKFRAFGPAISVRNHQLFQDTFPNSGAADLTDPAALSCRLDMAGDISSGTQIVPGDSVVASVEPLPGTSLVGTTLEWILDLNPLFAATRTMPPGTTVIPGGAANGWDQWRGSVPGNDTAWNTTFWFDLPDGPPNVNAPHQVADDAMFYPGDRLRYYFTAEDDLGRVSTLPADLTGFDDGEGWNREFLVRALPDMDQHGPTAELLYISAEGPGDHEDLMLDNLEDMLWGEPPGKTVAPSRFDVYSVKAGNSRVSNGIGSTGHHGPSLAQLALYDCVFYDSGRLGQGFPSDGTEIHPGDKADDIALLTQWHELPGVRNTVFMGDHVLGESNGNPFVENYLGVEYVDDDVSDDIGQEDPEIEPRPGLFYTSFGLDGGCPTYRTFDAIRPTVFAAAGHDYQPWVYTVFPSVVYSRTVNGANKLDITIPFSLGAVRSTGALVEWQNRQVVLADILEASGHNVWWDSAPQVQVPSLVLDGNRPNPFNPSTTIAFEVGRSADYRATVYNARGERVTVLWNGLLEAGRHELIWSGRDDRGRSVASGLYFLELTGDGLRRTHKMALLK